MSESYPYETLDAKRFQRLVQTLLSAELPDVESFPLSGADGGRDAIQAIHDGTKLNDAVIFQVKYREPQPLGVPTAADQYRWLTGQLKEEVPKLTELKSRGAQRYMVISNINASGGLNVGLRDKMKDWAEENLPLPTTFWWRDNLDTRLPKHYDLIFKFGLFTGPESVRAALEARMEGRDLNSPIQQSHTAPAILALMSYIADQYRLESKLRFEQADISGSPLLELFVDVPAGETRRRSPNKKFSDWMSSIVRRRGEDSIDTDPDNIPPGIDRYGPRHRFPPRAVGGADLLLAPEMPESGLRIVLEGAPGQGKSTLGQYVCQVHRIRLLRKDRDLPKLPKHHASSPVRLPIRIEFRHLATWFSGINPWTSEPMSPQNGSHYWANSLESFIAAHVRYSTGGMEFTPNDVVAILTKTPCFIFLDGLDEVPDVKLRAAIVEKSQASLNRLESLAADLQVLVTSRPAVFLKAPAFPSDKFDYLNLLALTRPLINSYTQAWMKVREIPEEQAKEIVQVLDTSINQTHVAELARNPMQLAILLWLISVKGRSLPDQRTALYDQYLTAFLDREAVKNSTVRSYRARLLEIHGFLGWVLHGRAESRDSRFAGGDITADELRSLLRDYLVHEERPTDLVDKLFEGAERVFVLVSRIEGKFEFEVQPLREFFAARYLYKTAPRSTYAEPAHGTRPDRLRQLVRNPYWLNVARFFCGWYDRGELADLSRQLRDLCEDPEYALVGYPRYLIAYILRDCTTAESQRDTRELVRSMTDPLGLRLLTSRHSQLRSELASQGAAILPEDCGAALFVDRLRDALLNIHTNEIRSDLARALRQNDPPAERAAWWLGIRHDERLNHPQWVVRGVETGAVAHISLEDAINIFDPETATPLDWIRCVEGGRFDVAFHDEKHFNPFMKALGDGASPIFHSSTRDQAGRIAAYSRTFSLSRLANARGDYQFNKIECNDSDPLASESMMPAIQPLDKLMKIAVQGTADKGPRPFSTRMSQLIEAAEATFGQSWLCWQLALIGATSARLPVGKSGGFLDADAKPLSRTRQAKLSSNDLDFWMDATSIVPESLSLRMAIYTAALSWADPNMLVRLLPQIAMGWGDLKRYDIRNMVLTLERLVQLSGTGRNASGRISKEALEESGDIPASLMCVLYFRTEESADQTLIPAIQRQYEDGSIADEHRSLVASVLTHYKVTNWDGQAPSLGEIAKYFSETTYGSLLGSGSSSPRRRRMGPQFHSILATPFSYPAGMVALADVASAASSTGKLRPLRDIALDEDWFSGLHY